MKVKNKQQLGEFAREIINFKIRISSDVNRLLYQSEIKVNNPHHWFGLVSGRREPVINGKPLCGHDTS